MFSIFIYLLDFGTSVAMEHNGLQIGGRFNAANVLLGVWFYLKFERWTKLFF